ncbi:MAG: glycosyltransferase family 9 protein [Nitrospirae bacterium]|nr:glycosyltransferase family 9 protein [Nitrospirota bacterium]
MAVKEIIIINLTRLGDLLQTTPLMAGFKEANPGGKITLVINSSFAEICKGIPFIDDLITFDMRGFRERLVQKKYNLVENFRFLDGLIDTINCKEYDLAMNLTHSPISALITSLVSAKEIRGNTVDGEGHRMIRHHWLRYFFNVIPNRDYNPFHLVDMYLKAGDVMPKKKGLIFEVQDEDGERAEVLLKDRGVKNDGLLFGIHLGASKSDKTWPVSAFAALANMITREFDAKIVLFGSPSETDLGREFETLAERKPVNFIGGTNIGELSALVKRCVLFVSNDTGPLHLATAVGTKVIDIFTANVHFMETGPYGEGHYVVQADIPCVPCAFDVKCNNMVCKDVINPEIIFEVVKESLGRKSLLATAGSPIWNNLQVYRTYFEDDGLLGFYPVVKKPLRKEMLYCILYREVWNTIPGRSNEEQDKTDYKICDALSSLYTLENLSELSLSLYKEINALEELISLAYKGAETAGLLEKEARKDDLNIEKLKAMSDSLESIDDQIKTIGHANPCLRPLIIVFAFSKEALEGDDLLKLTEDTHRIYRDLITRAGCLSTLMKKIMLFFDSITNHVEAYENEKNTEIHSVLPEKEGFHASGNDIAPVMSACPKSFPE